MKSIVKVSLSFLFASCFLVATTKSFDYKTSFPNPNIPFNTPVPTATVDWTSKMTPVKDQGGCASPQVFSSVALFEYWYKKTNPQTLFSEQKVISCSIGCDGGTVEDALEYLMNNGTVTSTELPYTGVVGKCPASFTKIYKGPQHYYEYYFPNGNCTRLKQLLTKGPVVAAISAPSSFFVYASGVITINTCPNDRNYDHVVLITGFIKRYSMGQDVFVVKNSWGTDWGVGGYSYIEANSNACSICNWLNYY